MPFASTTRLDTAAIGLSVGCAVHCIALPAVAAVLPFLGAAAEAEWVHWAMFAMAAPISLLALRHSYTSWAVRVVAATGLLGVLLGAVGWPHHDWEAPMTVAGGTLLMVAHLVNISRFHRRCSIEQWNEDQER